MSPEDPRPEDPDARPARAAEEASAEQAEPSAAGEAGAGLPEPGPSGPAGVPFRRPALEIVYPDEIDVDEDDEEDEDDDEFDDIRTVLITGASGHLGQKLRAAWDEVYDLVLIDTVAGHDEEVILADLSELDDGWITHFHGVDTVVHLAGRPDVGATWEELERSNIDAMANVLHACALAGVERVIFASSTHVMGGYAELGDIPITVGLPPRPDSPFGAAKLVGERLGRSLARAFDITFVAIRIGCVQPGQNRPETLPDDATRALWLSNRDLVQLVEAAIEAELEENQFLVVNGVSANRGSRWDMSAAVEHLDFTPEDDAYAEEL